MYAACALLLLFVEEVEAVAEAEAETVAEAEAVAGADAAQLRSRDFVWMPRRGCERWRLVLRAARAPHRPLPSLAPCLCFFHLQLLELPLPLQLLAVPLLSSQPFSWGLRLQEQGQGFTLARLELILKITLKTTTKN